MQQGSSTSGMTNHTTYLYAVEVYLPVNTGVVVGPCACVVVVVTVLGVVVVTGGGVVVVVAGSVVSAAMILNVYIDYIVCKTAVVVIRQNHV